MLVEQVTLFAAKGRQEITVPAVSKAELPEQVTAAFAGRPLQEALEGAPFEKTVVVGREHTPILVNEVPTDPNLTLPITSSTAVGDVVPMPTFPPGLMKSLGDETPPE